MSRYSAFNSPLLLGFDYPSYTLVDAALNYRDDDVRISLTVDNLTDKEWLLGGSSTPFFDLDSRNTFEGYGRRFRLTTEWLF